MKKDRKVEPKR